MTFRHFLPVLACGLVACVGDASTPPSGQDAGVDATGDAGPVEAAVDTGVDALVDAGTVYNDITDKNRWETLDLATLTGGLKFYNGGTFDGRYVYYTPEGGATPHGVLLRYDTTLPFATSSYEKYDLTQKNGALKSFTGAIFDGTYVYLPPYKNGAQYHGNFVRYKTSSPFGSATSYETYDLAANLDPLDVGFGPGAFDGKYVYITPFIARSAVRFDKAGTFNVAGSYESYVTTTNNENWVTSGFDGKYMYLVPGLIGGAAYYGGIKRYDTTKVFNQPASWLLYDVGVAVDPKAKGFQGSVFDGRYLYFIPAFGTVTVRYDTQGQFDSASSWTKFDLTLVNAGATSFVGGTFDGRYVYFSPFPGALAIRYDTQQTFAATPSWQVFDLTTKDLGAKGYAGAVFDGRHVYFVPNKGTVAARFDAKSPSSLPAFQSSFF